MLLYHAQKACIEYGFYVDNSPLQAAMVRSEADYKVLQGRTLHVQFQVNKEIKSVMVRGVITQLRLFSRSKKFTHL